MRTATENLEEGSGRLILQFDSIAESSRMVESACKFRGTDNPRQIRALIELLRRPMPREHLDREAGCSNGPELVASLRRRGLDLPCDRAPVIDRDGRKVERGVYRLSKSDTRKVRQWFATRTVNHHA